MRSRHLRSLAAIALPVAVTAAAFTASSGSAAPAGGAQSGSPTTLMISRSLDGGVPNGPSTNGVISNDKRYARLIAYQSDASDIVRGDTNGQTDVFAVIRQGPADNNGSAWRADRTILVSKPPSGVANGPSFDPVVDGAFRSAPKCVAFLSSASNLVAGDTNGKVDAFLSKGPGQSLTRVSLPGNRQSTADTTGLAISGDCSRVAFVTGGKLYVRIGGSTKAIRAKGTASDPSFSTGLRNDLVFAAGGGIYLSSNGTGRPKRINRGGSNPAYNDIKRRVVAYEIRKRGHVEIGYHDIGRRQKIISARRGSLGNADSSKPVIGNSGYYVMFQTAASNLSVSASGATGDSNRQPDSYLYTDTRRITLVESVRDQGLPLPGGGQNPSMSFYANYILFDSPAPLGSASGPHQVFMRYLGPV